MDLKPLLRFQAGIVKRQEPLAVKEIGPELVVKRLNERVIRHFAWPRKIELDTTLIHSPMVAAGDELRALIDPDRFGIAATR